MRRGLFLAFFDRYTPLLSPNTRSLRRPVENAGSAGAPLVRSLRGLPLPLFTYSLLPVTNAIFLQLPDTATAVVSLVACLPPGLEMRRGLRPFTLPTKASTLPLVSPRTRFVAEDRKPMQPGFQ